MNIHSTSRRRAAHAAGALLGFFTWTAASACSICRCGDPTFNALGKDVVASIGWRVAFDVDRYEKTQGEPALQESVVERRYTAVGAYTFGERALLVARLPFAERTLTEHVGTDIERTRETGLADPEIYGQIKLWSSPFRGDLGRRGSLAITAGLKTDWGVNDAQRAGQRLDEHVQPGTGSRDYFVGLSGYYLINTSSALFASVQRRMPGENDYGYRYGRISLANVAYEHKLNDRFDSVIELNYRNAGRDRVDFTGDLDPDTGGEMLYVTPRVLVNVGPGLVFRLAAQVPVASRLNGVQSEKTVYNIGFTHTFGGSD